MALKVDKKRSKDLMIGVAAILIVSTVSFFIGAKVYGAPGDPPENGQTSRIKTLYDSLSASSYGSDTNSPDRGAYWNRIITAGTWTPSGDASASEVLSGKTFYNSSRSVATGTRYRVGYCPTQLSVSNGYTPTPTPTTNCVSTISFTDATDGITGSDKKDPITNMVWSYPLIISTGTPTFSQFTRSGWTKDATGANNVTAGGRTALQLCSDRGSGWRLPTQVEFMQAYIDGAYWYLAQTATTYWTGSLFASGTPVYFNTGNGENSQASAGTSYAVRCIRDGSV